MPSPARRSPPTPRADAEFHPALAAKVRRLANPVDLFSGAKLENILLAQNVVLFKRTSVAELKPQGVTHNYHHRFELVIPLRQPGRIHVDGADYALAPGHAFLIFPHQFHHYLDLADGALTWLFITFELTNPALVQPLRNAPRALGAADAAALEELLDAQLAAATDANRDFEVIIRVSSLLQRLLGAPVARDARSGEPAKAKVQGEILQSINRYVRAHINEPLTIADLAKHTGYSISHLRAVFRRELGVSLGGYMRDSRLSLGTSLLAAPGRESIERIAQACGFASIFAFSRAFKRAMGVSPREYRKSLPPASAAATASKSPAARRRA
ncbi:AraC family transcriptional regulator [Horticoccus luteus]|uniref:AraC family transcriptional regulator n=1 Tax=Horticoccus luteus TaxID=2862869 RepID=A0A8F9TV65_9BACT|nr:AraC family transcriptional regulator [Horticoccus luteus]QYM78883.1 AraC family transcriptional regulator [Horticoccus luteus]